MKTTFNSPAYPMLTPLESLDLQIAQAKAEIQQLKAKEATIKQQQAAARTAKFAQDRAVIVATIRRIRRLTDGL